MKIISSKRGLHSPEFHRKKKKLRRIRIALTLAALLLLGVLLIMTSRFDKLLIHEVIVPGDEVLEREEVISTVEESLKGNYYWVFPRANALLYPETEIQENLLRKFPRYKSLNLDLKGFNTLSVSGDERKPFALYCNASDCYFLDKEGYIFATAPSFSDGVYFVYRGEKSSEAEFGNLFKSAEEFRVLNKFITSLTEFGIFPHELVIEEDDYFLTLQNDTKIAWKKNADLGVIYSNLSAFLQDENIKNQKDFLEKVAILDLRTENKIFYRFRE